MFGRRRTRLTDDEAAQVLDDLSAPTTRAGHRLRATAATLTPSAQTSQSELHRRRVHGAMMREFARGEVGQCDPVEPRPDSQLHTEQPVHAPVALIFDDVRIDMASVDRIDPKRAVESAEKLMQIAQRARQRNS